MKHKFTLFLGLLGCSAALLTTTQQVKADTVNNSQSQRSSSSDQTDQNKQNSNTDQNQQQSNQNSQTENNKNNQTNTSSTQTQSGWKTQNGQTYYLKNNKPVKGLKKIQNNWYLFNKNGIMLKDVRKIPHKSNYGYFDLKGRRRFNNTSTKKAYYWINKSGNITGIKNNAKVISQRPEMPTGCEITAVTMMVNFAGKNITKDQAAKIMPRSLNPNKGFIGSPYKEFPLGYWVAPNGVKPVVKHYLGTAVNMTNCSIAAIKRKLIRSHLVVVWVGWFDGFSNHAITLTGYHGNTLYYNDPWTGTKRKMSVQTFKRHWALDGHRALSY